MLIPRRVKHRKQHHPGRSRRRQGRHRGHVRRVRHPGPRAGLRHQPADRVGAYRHDPAHPRGGKVWINIYPDRPLTKKPAETRMGSGKGSPEWWVANVKPGRVMFELSGVPEPVAREALRRAMHKLPMKCRIVRREAGET